MNLMKLTWMVLVSTWCTPAVADTPLFDVPKLDGIVIDGKADDWGRRGFRVEAMAGPEGTLMPPDDLDSHFRLGWDGRGLLVLVSVIDDYPSESPNLTYLFLKDSVEIFLIERRGGKNMVQGVFAPGRAPGFDKPRFLPVDYRSQEMKKKAEVSFPFARTLSNNGYVLEVLVPWSNLQIAPAVGRELGFQIYVNDTDRDGGEFHSVWYPAVGTFMDTQRAHRIRLAEAPGAPILGVVFGEYEMLRNVRISIRGAGELAGRPFTIRAGDTVLARGTFGDHRGRAHATVRLPMPPRGRPYGKISVTAGGKTIDTLELPDPDEMRAREFIGAGPTFRPYVFDGEDFPRCRFERPLWVQTLIGPNKIEVAWYDRDYNRVPKAAKPGRYGAVISIRTEGGRVFTRYRTLYRTPKPWRWWSDRPRGQIELPSQMGIDPAVAAVQEHAVRGLVASALASYGERSQDATVILAGLSEMAPGREAVTPYDDPRAMDRQWWVGLKRKLNGNDKRFAKPFVCPRPIEGDAAPVLRVGTPAEAGMKADAPQKLDALLTEWATDNTPFIACVARRGVIVLHKAYGMQGAEPMTATSPCVMASLTKLIHGTAMMMCVDQKLIDLDAPVDDILPAFRGVKVRTPMTPRHLFTHTAGMWGHWGDDLNDFEHVVADIYPHLKVAQDYQYNGMDLALASKMIVLQEAPDRSAGLRAHDGDRLERRRKIHGAGHGQDRPDAAQPRRLRQDALLQRGHLRKDAADQADEAATAR